MKFERLLELASRQPLFETGLLLAGGMDPNDVRRQLSRWVKAGRVIQLRRGLYTLAAPYQQEPPHPFLAANAMLTGSYVSMQSALAYYRLIPEHALQTTSVTMRRPARWQNQLGIFRFQHLAAHLYFGYRQVSLSSAQSAFVASPEKALLDLVHLTPGADDPGYLEGLRLQNMEQLDGQRLQALAQVTGKLKWLRAVSHILKLMGMEMAAFSTA